MRSIMGYAAALFAATIMAGAAPASAKWDCQGPAYACQSSSSVSLSEVKAKKVRYAKKIHKATKSVSYSGKKAKRSYTASNYASGSSGKASYYWQPQRVASGGWFNPNALTAAHKTLPFGTKVRVTNKVNGRSVVVTINDRGPFIAGRIIDLSRAAAQSISMTGMGVAPVALQVLGRG